jgi:hypothetical protein
MLQTYSLAGTVIYYDAHKKTLARCPSKSNLLLKGADNSLYFGIDTNNEVSKIFCKIFNVSTVKKLQDSKYDLSFCGEIVEVYLNINGEGQIQVRFNNDGTIGRILSKYADEEREDIDFTKMLLVVDFGHKEIRLKNPNELHL